MVDNAMNYNEKWNFIVELYNKYYGEYEHTIQMLWESIFSDLFGYSRLSGEIISQEPIPVGASNRLIMDILIKSNSENLFVVELKRLHLPINNDFINQLTSYLNQTHNAVGILVCNKIYVMFYDHGKNEKVESIIEFTKDNPDGIKFVELFSKGNFDKIKVKEFIEQKNISVKNINKIKQELTPELLVKLARMYFSKSYSENEIESVLSTCNIEITEINANVSVQTATVNKTPISANVNNILKISRPEAKALCNKNGISLSDRWNLSNRVSAGAGWVYWLNAKPDSVNYDWYIIFNDDLKRELHIFKIPKNTYTKDQFYIKEKPWGLIDIRCHYGDKNFTDIIKGHKLIKWKIKTISY